jgi:hypothetical protein
MPNPVFRLLIPIATAQAALLLLAAAPFWLEREARQGASTMTAAVNLLFPVLLGVMFGLTLKPRYVRGYSLFTLALTGGLLACISVPGTRGEAFALMYAVLLMVVVQTGVLAWRQHFHPDNGP